MQCPSRRSGAFASKRRAASGPRSEEHTSELQSHLNLVCRLLLEKKNKKRTVQDIAVRRVIKNKIGAGGTCTSSCTAVLPFFYSFSRLTISLCLFFFFFFNERGPTKIPPFPLPAAFPT